MYIDSLRSSSMLMYALLLLSTGSWGAEQTPLPVEVVVPVQRPMPEEIQVTGTLIAQEWVKLAPEISGKIKLLPFTEGGAVKQGDLIVQLDDALLAAELRQAQASYELARLRHERDQKLLKSNSISRAVYDESLAELDEGRAVLEVAQVKLDKSRILAPFDGYISLRDVSVGTYVTAGEELLILVDDRPLRLDFRVPERIAHAVTPGTVVHFEIGRHGRSQRYEATVTATQPAITPNSRTLLARAIYPNADRSLLAGSFARVELVLGGEEPVLAIPEEALIGTAGGYRVFTVVEGRARLQEVETGVRRDGFVAVTAGLREGSQVVVAGHQLLTQNRPVTIVPPGN